MKKLPIGVSNFHKLVSNDYLFCDKTAMIADLLESGDEVTLITRPRRWGKTLNVSMLQHFLAQIEAQAYHTELLQYPHVKEVVECGIAFSGKSVVAAYVTYDLVLKKSGDVTLTSRYSEQEIIP